MHLMYSIKSSLKEREREREREDSLRRVEMVALCTGFVLQSYDCVGDSFGGSFL